MLSHVAPADSNRPINESFHPSRAASVTQNHTNLLTPPCPLRRFNAIRRAHPPEHLLARKLEATHAKAVLVRHDSLQDEREPADDTRRNGLDLPRDVDIGVSGHPEPMPGSVAAPTPVIPPRASHTRRNHISNREYRAGLTRRARALGQVPRKLGRKVTKFIAKHI